MLDRAQEVSNPSAMNLKAQLPFARVEPGGSWKSQLSSQPTSSASEGNRGHLNLRGLQRRCERCDVHS